MANYVSYGLFTDCDIHDNYGKTLCLRTNLTYFKAQYGGVVGQTLLDTVQAHSQFHNCRIYNNRAFRGAVMYFAQAFPETRIIFSDCNVYNNTYAFSFAQFAYRHLLINIVIVQQI